MAEFSPELGQLAFSNGAIYPHEVSDLGIAALSYLSAEIERVMWNRTQSEYDAPSRAYGEQEFDCPAFVMRRYCFCDGDTHPNGCPPNLEWKSRGVSITWYKHAQRGVSSSITLSPDDINEFLEEALAAVREMDAALY